MRMCVIMRFVGTRIQLAPLEVFVLVAFLSRAGIAFDLHKIIWGNLLSVIPPRHIPSFFFVSHSLWSLNGPCCSALLDVGKYAGPLPRKNKTKTMA